MDMHQSNINVCRYFRWGAYVPLPLHRQREQLAPIAQSIPHKAMLLPGLLRGNSRAAQTSLQNDVLPVDAYVFTKSLFKKKKRSF